jgi:nucleotide-binding universal stress UspA family protein
VKLDSILVSVTGEPTDEDVLVLATSLARRFNSKIYAIYVIEVKRALPIDAEIEPEIEKGEHLLDRVEQDCEAAQISVETELLQARDIGAAIVDEAVERNVDGIILGISQRRRPGESEVGSTAASLLKNAPCRVWLARAPEGREAQNRR